MNDDALLLSVLRKVMTDDQTYWDQRPPLTDGSVPLVIDGGAIITPEEGAALDREFDRLHG